MNVDLAIAVEVNLIAQFLCYIITKPLVTKLWKDFISGKKLNYEREPGLSEIVGFFDMLFYTNAWILGFPEFCAVWLAVKLTGEWHLGESGSRSVFYVILIGNSSNLAIGSLAGLAYQWIPLLIDYMYQ